jgi:hypothetical protein
MKAEKEKLTGLTERSFSQIFEPDEVETGQDTVLNPPQEKIDTLKPLRGLGEKGFSDEQTARALSLFFVKLANNIKTNLSMIKALAELSRGKFKDIEFENNFIKTVNAYIHDTHTGLDCFFDYLKIRSLIRKRNRVHIILEEILDGIEKELKDRKIQIVKKQFEMDLPETSIPDDHLRYILNWVVQYIISSASLNGNIGLLTRSFDSQEVKDDPKASLKKDGKYIEIIIFLMTREKVTESSQTELGAQGIIRKNENDFILPLVEEIIRMNGGMIRVKVDHKKDWRQISLILPA